MLYVSLLSTETNFQRIGNHTRMGGPENLQVQRFCEAAEDPSSGLTYSALTGLKKQSIGDVERLFSSEVAEFMERRNYTYEAEYVRTIHNWRRATDERGLSQQQRSEFNQKMLDMILDELIPWHKVFDYSTLEVNRLECKEQCRVWWVQVHPEQLIFVLGVVPMHFLCSYIYMFWFINMQRY